MPEFVKMKSKYDRTKTMIDKLKLADRQYKELMPKFVTMKSKYDRMKTCENQAAKEVIQHKQHVALLESQLQDWQKVCHL